MPLIQNQLYHFYNQGNNREVIFHNRDNYLLFLKKFRKNVSPHCKVLAFCLMPNHFHFLVYTTEDSVKTKTVGSLSISNLNDGFRHLLSSYAKAINSNFGRSGSLFRQKTKAKLLENRDVNYPFVCFQYIHQNPLKAGLVNRMEDWEFSSYWDYVGLRDGKLCDHVLANELLGLSKDHFYEESYKCIENPLTFPWTCLPETVWRFVFISKETSDRC